MSATTDKHRGSGPFWSTIGKARVQCGLGMAFGLAALLVVASSTPAAAADAPCVDGYSLVAPTSTLVPQDVYTLSPGKALVAGARLKVNGKRVATVDRYKTGSGWLRQGSISVLPDAGFVAIDGSASSRPWAVGYAKSRTTLIPLLARRNADGSWTRSKITTPSSGGTLTDVSASSAKRAWAVGFRLSANGSRRPWAIKWSAGHWSGKSPGLRADERGALTGVSSTPQGGTWIVGSVLRGTAERFYLARRADGAWKRKDLGRFGHGALTAISVPKRDVGWAVGYRSTASGRRALVLRWDGTRWEEIAPPPADGTSVLLDVSVGPDGQIAVSGSIAKSGVRRMRGFVAEWNGSGWDSHVEKVLPWHGAMPGVDGDPSGDGWVVGRELTAGIVARTCTPEPAGLASTSAAKDKKLKQAVRKQRRAEVTRAAAEVASIEPHPVGADPAPRADLPPARKLEVAATGGVTIRDKAEAVGLPTKGRTYGAVIRDFDGDGRPDIFLGGHANRAALYLDAGSRFKDAGVDFGGGDRHGCAAADVDGSGLPDLYCSFGGGRGLGVKTNQLWLDPGGSAPRLADDVGGALEPLGRGRDTVFIDVDDDGRKDLVVGQQPDRLDGLPSINSVYLRTGLGRFALRHSSGLPTSTGAHGFDQGDIDRDGRMDLLLVYHDPKEAGAGSGIKLLRNTKSGFRNVTGAYGIKGIGERDAELVRLDDDKKLDLVQLSGDRIRISVQRKGRFVKVYERRITKAVAVAAGDADGDGDKDLYIVRQKDSSTIKDLVLFNRGNGRDYRAVKAPSRKGGKADDAFPIDHDGNGLTDFLVLNGRGMDKGPIQLISFYR